MIAHDDRRSTGEVEDRRPERQRVRLRGLAAIREHANRRFRHRLRRLAERDHPELQELEGLEGLEGLEFVLQGANEHRAGRHRRERRLIDLDEQRFGVL